MMWQSISLKIDSFLTRELKPGDIILENLVVGPNNLWVELRSFNWTNLGIPIVTLLLGFE